MIVNTYVNGALQQRDQEVHPDEVELVSDDEDNDVPMGGDDNDDDDDVDMVDDDTEIRMLSETERFKSLKVGQVVEIQMYGDIEFYECLLLQYIEEDADEDNPDEHFLIVYTGPDQTPGALYSTDNYRLKGEVDVSINQSTIDYSVPQQGATANERARRRQELKDLFHIHNPEVRKNTGKSTNWKRITGLWAAFRSASKINEMATSIFEYFLYYAAADPNQKRLLCLTCDAETYNFVRHILYRCKNLHPEMDFGFVLLVPELWHATQAALLSILGDRPKSGVMHNMVKRLIFLLSRDRKDLTDARFSLKHTKFSSLHMLAGCFSEAWQSIRAEFLVKYPPEVVHHNVDLQALITTLDYSLDVILTFLRDIKDNPPQAEAALRDLFVVLNMNNAHTYSAIILKFISDLERLKEYEPDFHTYATENFNALIGVFIEHMHSEMAGMYNPLAGTSESGHASPTFQIARMNLMRSIRAWHEGRHLKTSGVALSTTPTYVLMKYQHQKYRQHHLYCINTIWTFARAALMGYEVDLAASESVMPYILPDTLHKYVVKLQNYKTTYRDLGITLTKILRRFDPTNNHDLFSTYDADGFYRSDTPGTRDGFVFKNGPKGIGFYKDSAQIYETESPIVAGEELDVEHFVVDGTYTLVYTEEDNYGKLYTAEICNVVVKNEKIANFPCNIKIYPGRGEAMGYELAGGIFEVVEYAPTATLTFYAVNFKNGFSKGTKTIDSILPHPVTGYGPFQKQPARRETDMQRIHANDVLLEVAGHSTMNSPLTTGFAFMNMIEQRYDAERKKLDSQNKHIVALVFGSHRPLQEQDQSTISSHAFGKYSAKCTLVKGQLNARDLQKKASSATNFDEKFNENCLHPRIIKLDNEIEWYWKSLQKIKELGMEPSKRKGESMMYRQTMKTLLATLEKTYNFVEPLTEDDIRAQVHDLVDVVAYGNKRSLRLLLFAFEDLVDEGETMEGDGVVETDEARGTRRKQAIEQFDKGALQSILSIHLWKVKPGVLLAETDDDDDDDAGQRLKRDLLTKGLRTLRIIAGERGASVESDDGTCFNERVLRGMLVADVLTLKSRFHGYQLQNDVVVRVGH